MDWAAVDAGELPEELNVLGSDGEEDDERRDETEDWYEDEVQEMINEGYEEEGRDWGDEPEELPEVIFTTDEDGYDHEEPGQDGSLTREESNYSEGQRVHCANCHSGDVDAVRVVLLGMSDSGRPSVGIDLGFACTGEHGDDEGRCTRCHPLCSRCASEASLATSQPPPNPNQPARGFRSGNSWAPVQSRPSPNTPFVFRPPPTPTRRKHFMFSEHAAHNKQTFVFQGSSNMPDFGQGSSPSKFCSSRQMMAAMRDSDFVLQVVLGLPGVNPDDPRLQSMRPRSTSRPGSATSRPTSARQRPTSAATEASIAASLAACMLRPPSAGTRASGPVEPLKYVVG
mmetsp:Transcript_38911/g.84297  ORF Transcript_38911/g.84297 Transcript_38911/m.84297 type:complete len:341 (+) Transcript_38911:2-1024(+)